MARMAGVIQTSNSLKAVDAMRYGSSLSSIRRRILWIATGMNKVHTVNEQPDLNDLANLTEPLYALATA